MLEQRQIASYKLLRAKTAALAIKRFFRLKSVFPCHYASFPMVEKDASNFLAEMNGHSTQVIVTEKGKAVEV